MTNKNLKKIITNLIIVFLCLPAILQFGNLVSAAKLNGAYLKIPRPQLNYMSFQSSEYQNNSEQFLVDNSNIRPWLVRINNQIHYTFFGENKSTVVIGKDYQLYTNEYIDAYQGKDFVGFEKIKSDIELYEKLNKKLEEKNKHLIFIFAPSKADVYPEYLPDNLNMESEVTNYKEYSKALDKLDSIHYLDFNSEFKIKKLSSLHPLYPQCGAHWSEYGMITSMNEFFDLISGVGDIRTHKIIMNDIDPEPNVDRVARDNELQLLMNLAWNIQCEEMYYPKIEITAGVDEVKPNVLVIADSYYGSFFRLGLEEKFFGNYSYWYYGKSVKDLNGSDENPVQVADLDLQSEMAKYDFIVIMHTTHSLKEFGYGFLQDACRVEGC